MDNRRVLLAVLLSMIVIIGWQLTFPAPEPPAPAEGTHPTTTATGTADPGTDPTRVADAGRALPGETGEGAAVEVAGDDEATPGEDGAVRVADREETVLLEGDGFRAAFSNRGGQLVSLELPGHDDGEGKPVDLVRLRRETAYPFGLVALDGTPLPVDDELFVVEDGTDETDDRDAASGARRAVVFRYSGPRGRVTKRFAIEKGFVLSVTIDAQLASPWAVALGPGLRNPSEIDDERKFKYRGVVYLSGEDVTTLLPEKLEESKEVSGAGLSWIGVEDTYFLSAVRPRTPLDRAVVRPWTVVPETEQAPPRFTPVAEGGTDNDDDDERPELQVALVPQGDRFEADAYLGAKDLVRLESLHWGLEKTVRLGWFGFLARIFLVGLKWIHANVVGNYGWAIVLMTIAIKLVLLPLTHKSYVSMQKMQELAPRIKGIRAKYKGKLRDKKGRPDIEQQRKMNEEVAALYRTEGVNPAGGCLPMLLQFPVLLGFYKLLSHAVELRGAPWVLWINDLSMHDPIYVLPIVMGAVQFLQQKMAPSGGDAMQRKMMMAMPVVFTFLFMGFPSGLVLYWLTNNVLTLIQQLVYQRIKARRATEPGVA